MKPTSHDGAPRKTMLSWSTGKDSAWTCYYLQNNPDYDLTAIFCTVNQKYERTAMHAVRIELLQQQAARLNLPLHILEIPYPCSNQQYDKVMQEFIDQAIDQHVECMAFGDLFLEDIRAYRVEKLKASGIEPVFPLWGRPTAELALEMINGGLKAVITCVDPKQLDESFAGRVFDKDFVQSLPEGVDPCGENGEFHSFVYEGPMFSSSIPVSVGQTKKSDGFQFVDIQPGESLN